MAMKDCKINIKRSISRIRDPYMADPRKEEKSFMQPNSRQRCTYVTTKEGGWVGVTDTA